MSNPSPPSGWYPDPQAPPGHLRYWDGERWTAHQSAPVQQPFPPAAPPQATPAKSRAWLGWVVALVVAVVAIAALADDEPEATSDDSSDVSTRDESSNNGGGAGADPDTTGDRPDDADDSSTEEPAPPVPRTYLVRSVTDGDTLRLANGEEVRLVGIDAPESGRCGSERARQLLSQLTLGKRVTLPAPVDDRDIYGRLLRYVDAGATDAGLSMIASGLAIARYDSRDGYDPHPREGRYVRTDRSTKDVVCAPPKPAPLAPQAPSGCEPGYSPCVPLYPPDLDCADTGPVTVTGSDPHGLDADDDGVACGGD